MVRLTSQVACSICFLRISSWFNCSSNMGSDSSKAILGFDFVPVLATN